MKKLFSYFMQGLLFIVPIAVTLYVIYIIFVKIDRLLRIPIPGIGFITTLAIIICVGFLVSRIFSKGLLKLIDISFNRIPIVKIVYSSVKDLIGAFTKDKKMFGSPVLVTIIPQSNIRAVGFITNDDLTALNLIGDVAVYMPQSYNFAGNLIIVPKSQVTPIDKPGSEVMAFIVSAGISGK
ncbi:MAG: DUF502 domain-containing protein [Elusimicrobiota bacterium]|nr:DUF502 domain-containing protein [Elusimicrobiota bacterium]